MDERKKEAVILVQGMCGVGKGVTVNIIVNKWMEKKENGRTD